MERKYGLPWKPAVSVEVLELNRSLGRAQPLQLRRQGRQMIARVGRGTAETWILALQGLSKRGWYSTSLYSAGYLHTLTFPPTL